MVRCNCCGAGSAIPEGETAYVLTEEADGFRLWNASTGEHFNCTDNYCPLQSVGCVVNAENVRIFMCILCCLLCMTL